MGDRRSCLWTIVMVLVGASSAFALAGSHGKGDPKRPISCSNWPEGVKELVNREDRVAGYFINANDWFYYVGDARAFNDFASRYAKLNTTPRTVYLRAGDPFVKRQDGAAVQDVGYDWELSVTGWGMATASVSLVLGGRIALKDVMIPPDVDVDVIGEKTPEVETFLAAHRARRAKAGVLPPVSSKRTPEAAWRAELLASRIQSFRLDLEYVGEQDKPYYNLSLSVAKVREGKNIPFHPTIQITEKQARGILAHLAADGFLDRARDLSQDANARPPLIGPSYSLTVSGSLAREPVILRENLGWGLAMLRRLEALGTVFEGEAAEAMDRLIGRLFGHRREWEGGGK